MLQHLRLLGCCLGSSASLRQLFNFSVSLALHRCAVPNITRPLRMLSYAKEKPILYRRYVTLHGIIICAAFAIAAVWVIVSATRHSTASSNCIQRFFSDGSLQSQGQTLCDIFSWVDVGIMAGLWVLLAIFQVG